MTTDDRPDEVAERKPVPLTAQQRADLAETRALMAELRARSDAMRAERLRTGAPMTRI
jgi:hypothetical protein